MIKHKGVFDEVIILTPQNLSKYIDIKHKEFYKFRKAGQRADYIRIMLMKKYGGVWLDADTLIMRDLSILKEWIDEYGCFWGGAKGNLTGVIGFQPKHPAADWFYKEICNTLKEKGDNIYWTNLGPMIFDKFMSTFGKKKHFNIPKRSFYYLSWNGCHKVITAETSEYCDKIIANKEVIGICCWNNRLSQKKREFCMLKHEKLLQKKCVFTDLYKDTIR
jgi:hypothetical protein